MMGYRNGLYFACFLLLSVSIFFVLRKTKESENDFKAGKFQKRSVSQKGTNKIAVVVMACNRIDVQNCLDSIMLCREINNSKLDFYISHGCEDSAVKKIAKRYKKFEYLKFDELENFLLGYKKIANHYLLMLSLIFDSFGYEKIIIIEDDLEICKFYF